MRARRLLLAVVLLSGAWALTLYAGYGHSWSIGPLRISTRNPLRPLLVCAAAAAGYALVSGLTGMRRDAARVIAAVQSGARVGSRIDPAAVALLIAAASVVTSLRFNETTAGGSDAYSYVTQADLWLRGNLRVEIPMAAHAPWPGAISTLTPFGYRETPDRRAIVPVTGPGLPLMMAVFKAAAGHCAMFWVVPLTGGLLVLTTFTIGRRLGSDTVGLAAAWLVATSPTFLSMSRWVMSDVPAAAFWSLTISLALCRSVIAAFGAGVSASAAILIRPNLLPVGLVIGAWSIWRELKAGSERRPARVVAFAAGAMPGCVAVAAINTWLYGSPSSSGYGDLNSLFSLANVTVNVRRYGMWVAETQTPLAIAGAAALLIPWRRLWPTLASRDAARLLALTMLAVFGAYCAYIPFDAWWFLRFLLPAWPSLAIGTAALIVGLPRTRPAWLRGLGALVVVALGLHTLSLARHLGVYPAGEGERRYATIAELVARVTEPSSVIITNAHVGPVRYYAGRLTIRFDALDPAWLDRAVRWLADQGRHPYILLEEHEVPEFQRRFAAASSLGRFEMTPILVYEAHRIGGRVYLADPLNPAAATWQPAPIQNPEPRCPLPSADAAESFWRDSASRSLR